MVDVSLLQSLSYVAAALGVCMASVYYIMTLRVQQRIIKGNFEARQMDILQRHAQLNTQMNMIESWHDLVFNQSFLTYEEWMKDYGPHNSKSYCNFAAIVQYYELLGGILRDGYVSMDIVEKIWQPIHIVLVWIRVEPVIKAWRDIYKDDSIYSNIEYLFSRYLERHPEAADILEIRREQMVQEQVLREQMRATRLN